VDGSTNEKESESKALDKLVELLTPKKKETAVKVEDKKSVRPLSMVERHVIDTELKKLPDEMKAKFEKIVKALPTADEQLALINTINGIREVITGSAEVTGGIKEGGPSSGESTPKYSYPKPAWMGDKNVEDMFR